MAALNQFFLCAAGAMARLARASAALFASLVEVGVAERGRRAAAAAAAHAERGLEHAPRRPD
eukprot:6202068-Pleurochrysis_carterae.AAC.3